MPSEYIYERDGLRLEGRAGTNDYQIFGEVVELDCYRLRAEPLRPGCLVVDIGAHVGAFSVMSAAQGAGRVLAFEMDAGNFALLIRNAATWPAIEARHAAVVGRGRVPMGYSATPDNTGGHHVAWHDDQNSVALPDATATLQVLLQWLPADMPIDMLKIDCEGCEHEILRACVEDGTLARVQRIAGEYHDFFGDSTASLLELLTRAGFDVEAVPIGDHSGTFYGRRA